MKDDRERLLDMLEAVERVERYTQRGRAAFERDELIQTWVVHHLQIVGEAAAKVSRQFQQTYPQVPWPQVVAMRNVLVHDYFGIDLDEVWQVVARDLPDLKRQIEAVLAQWKEQT